MRDLAKVTRESLLYEKREGSEWLKNLKVNSGSVGIVATTTPTIIQSRSSAQDASLKTRTPWWKPYGAVLNGTPAVKNATASKKPRTDKTADDFSFFV